ncbi:MAG: electron transfer flavoprotein subunit alpha/FixB family protein, partial [Bacteroidota bacterium]|nr:electron transfer flavoprotein subunit alpha/FixB family protein [Bacteroidota bacterium]
MSVLVYTESWEGNFRKSTYEAVSYASETAKLLGTDVIAIAFGNESDHELKTLGNYGANKVLAASGVEKGDSKTATHLFTTNTSDANIIIFANTYTSKMIAPRLAAKLKAGIASNVITVPSSTSPIQIKRKSFSSKALEDITINTEQAIIILAPNAFGLVESGNDCKIEKIKVNSNASVTINGQEVASGKISLAEAEIIVSAGRGLKGPENWKM